MKGGKKSLEIVDSYSHRNIQKKRNSELILQLNVYLILCSPRNSHEFIQLASCKEESQKGGTQRREEPEEAAKEGKRKQREEEVRRKEQTNGRNEIAFRKSRIKSRNVNIC